MLTNIMMINTINYKTLSVITSAITAFLFLVLLLTPEIFLLLFQVETNEAVLFVSRRMSILFLAISIVCWVGRDSPNCELRQAFCMAIACSMGALALLGIFEFAHDVVGKGIFVAITFETVLSYCYFQCWRINQLL